MLDYIDNFIVKFNILICFLDFRIYVKVFLDKDNFVSVMNPS